MAYTSGNKILASDYNSFLNQINLLYAVGNHDRGYGQTLITQNNISASNIIRSSHWSNLYNMMNTIGKQQQDGLPEYSPIANFNVGSIVYANTLKNSINNSYQLQTLITLLDTNRLIGADDAFTEYVSSYTVTRVNDWGGYNYPGILAEIQVEWSNEDHARYFFNSSSGINITLNQPLSLYTDQNIDWYFTFLDKVGIISFKAYTTYNTGTKQASEDIGFYDLTDTFQLIFNGYDIGDSIPTYVYQDGHGYSGYSGSAYANNDIFVYAKRINYNGVNGGNGNGIVFRILLFDRHTGSSDTVSGGTNAVFGFQKATTYLSGIESPSFSTILDFVDDSDYQTYTTY